MREFSRAGQMHRVSGQSVSGGWGEAGPLVQCMRGRIVKSVCTRQELEEGERLLGEQRVWVKSVCPLGT